MSNIIRGLSQSFLDDLGHGKLEPLLGHVKNDSVLQLAIRDDYINIYYRGGSILRLEKKENLYNASFDKNYVKDNILEYGPDKIYEKNDIRKRIKCFPILKQAMDAYFSGKAKMEREFQQVVARENNCSTISNDTDYFIVDIEFALSGKRFDMLAVKWPSEAITRKKDELRLAFIEMKYGTSSLDGSAGITKHLEDFQKICADKTIMQTIRRTAQVQMQQLNNLGLLKHTRIEDRNFQISEEKPEVIMLFANHKPSKSKLRTILKSDEVYQYANSPDFDLRFFVAHSAGYGLFDACMKTLDGYNKNLQDK